MRECQLCGAKSWGPLTTTGTKWVQDRAAEVVPSSRLASLRECDACGSIADESVISKPVSVPELRLSEFPRIADGMPQPETRLERIIRALCGNVPLRKPAEFSDVQNCEAYASTICLIATLIEKRLSESAP